MNESFRTIGIYVSEDVVTYFSESLYEGAGIIDITEYFDSQKTTVPYNDPGAQLMNDSLETVVENFSTLYDAADFDKAASYSPDGYQLLMLAASPETTYAFRELVDAAATIQRSDSRTIHTGIFTVAIEDDYLPAAPISD